VSVIEGLSHAQFASGTPTNFVKKHDLKPGITEKQAHQAVASEMVRFLKGALAGQQVFPTDSTKQQMEPFLTLMELEGNNFMKPPCNDNNIINTPSPTCLKGSPWMDEYAVPLMLQGPYKNSNIKFVNNDNFHPAKQLFPYHHPEIASTCPGDTTTECTVEHISVTTLHYTIVDEHFDFGTAPAAATEMKAKIKSAQSLRWAGGESEATFEQYDEKMDECQNINQAAWDLAYSMASDEAKAAYDNEGSKYVMVEDSFEGNGGLWIIKHLNFTESEDKTTVTV